MLDFGSFKTSDCENGIGRRSFLKTASALPFAFGAGYGGIDLEAARKLGDRAKVIHSFFALPGYKLVDSANN